MMEPEPEPVLTVALTGATGLVGSVVATTLARAGHPLRILIRPRHEGDPVPTTLMSLGDDVTLVQGDLADSAAVTELLKGVGAVVHLAYSLAAFDETNPVSQAEHLRTNIFGTQQLLELARQAGTVQHFIATSSTYLLRADHTQDDDEIPPTAAEEPPIPEDLATTIPASGSYLVHNKCLEAALDYYSSFFSCTRLRCAWIYGVPNREIVRHWPSAEAANVPLLSKLRRGEAVDGRFGCDWVHVVDIAAVVAAILRTDGSADRNRVVHCTEGFAYQQDLAAVAAMALGVTAPSRAPLNPPRVIASSGPALGVVTLGNAAGVHWERAGRFLAYMKVLAEATDGDASSAL